MARSISPSLSHRMRGLLFPYRFSSVVISFFLCVCTLCMGKQKKKKKEGIELRERKKGGGGRKHIDGN